MDWTATPNAFWFLILMLNDNDGSHVFLIILDALITDTEISGSGELVMILIMMGITCRN